MGSHGNIHGLLAEQLGDLASGKVLLAPGNNFAPGLGSYFPPWTTTFGGRLGEVDLPVPELMSQYTQVSNAEAKTFGNQLVW